MNYIAEIKAFQGLAQDKQLSSGQIALWYALMYINNKCGWAEWFTVANLSLELNSGLSRQGIIKARNILKQNDIIDFKSNGTKATSYKIISMLNSVQDSIQDSVQDKVTMLNSVQDGIQVGVQVGVQDSIQVGVQSSSTLNKLNNTKLNQTKKIKELCPASPDTAHKIIEYLNSKTGSAYKPNSKSTQNKIKARLNEGFTLDDFIAVIDKKCAEWLFSDMSVYLRPETLFGTKFESYLNQFVVKGDNHEPNNCRTANGVVQQAPQVSRKPRYGTVVE